MLRDRSMSLGLDHHYGNITCLGANGVAIAPNFVLVFMICVGLTRYLVDHDTLAICCHVGCHVYFSSI